MRRLPSLVFALLWSLGCDPTDSASDAGALDGGAIDAAGGAPGADGAAGGAPGADAGASDVPQAANALDKIRTFAFHELTRLPVAPRNWPVISGDGAVVAYTTTGGTPAKLTVSIIRADGTGQQDLDTFEPLCHCDARLDISFDGKSVVSNDAMQIRFAEMGVGARSVLVLNSNEIWDARLSDDANRIFFLLRRDAAVVATGLPLQRGVYVINTNGTGLRQITGPMQVAGLLSMTPDKVFPFAGCGHSLDVSRDGSRIAFAAATAGMESVYAVNTDGTGLRKLVDASAGHKLVGKVALSGNGNLVAYHAYVGDNLLELGVINFDGTGRRMLGMEPPAPLAGCQGHLRLTTDAKKLYVSEPGYLYETDGSGLMQLSSPAFRPGAQVVYDGTPQGWMNQTGNRFAFLSVDQANANIAQVMFMEIDPVNLGEAPQVSVPTFTPKQVTVAGLATATATVAASGPGLIGVAVLFFSGGLPDLIDRGGGMVFNDMGMRGDEKAGDGIFTGVGHAAFHPPKPGPKTLRFTAEARVNGKRHATVLEAGTVTLVP